MGAKAAGATSIVGIDLNESKFPMAMDFGATECLNPKNFPADKPFQSVLVEKTDGGSKIHGHGKLGLVEVDTDDRSGTSGFGTHDHRQTNGAESPNGDGGSLFDAGCVKDGAISGGNATSEKTDLIERRLHVDLSAGNLGDDRVFAERRRAHEMEQRLALATESGGSVGHLARSLRGTNLGAQIGLGGLAKLAISTLWNVTRNDVITNGNGSHAFAYR